MIRGVVFDLDGMLMESEEYWERSRAGFVAAYGGKWGEDDQRAVMGANTRQWSRYIRERFAPRLSDEAIAAAVIAKMMAFYREHLPLLPGAIRAVEGLAELYPLAIASSSPPALIRLAVEEMGLADRFRAIVSSDEVERGKPMPDVYLLACARLGVPTGEACAFEDSAAGITAAHTAGLRVVAVANRAYPPDPAVLADADLVLPSLESFRPEMLRGL